MGMGFLAGVFFFRDYGFGQVIPSGFLPISISRRTGIGRRAAAVLVLFFIYMHQSFFSRWVTLHRDLNSHIYIRFRTTTQIGLSKMKKKNLILKIRVSQVNGGSNTLSSSTKADDAFNEREDRRALLHYTSIPAWFSAFFFVNRRHARQRVPRTCMPLGASAGGAAVLPTCSQILHD
jgi:hypothetical protein